MTPDDEEHCFSLAGPARHQPSRYFWLVTLADHERPTASTGRS